MQKGSTTKLKFCYRKSKYNDNEKKIIMFKYIKKKENT